MHFEVHLNFQTLQENVAIDEIGRRVYFCIWKYFRSIIYIIASNKQNDSMQSIVRLSLVCVLWVRDSDPYSDIDFWKVPLRKLFL